MIKKQIALLLLVTGTFAACNTTTSPNTSSNLPSQPNTMYFTVNSSTTDTLTDRGVDTTIYGIKGTGIIGVGASTSRLSGFGAGIALAGITSTGTYNVGTVTITNPATYVLLYYTGVDTSGNQVKYSTPTAPSLSSAGSITIDSLTASSVAGTFNGTLTRQSGNGPDTLKITNGAFRASIL